jgi:hypothetical protein
MRRRARRAAHAIETRERQPSYITPITRAKPKSAARAQAAPGRLRIKETKAADWALKPAPPRTHCYLDNRRMFLKGHDENALSFCRTGVKYESTKKQCFSLYAREDSP